MPDPPVPPSWPVASLARALAALGSRAGLLPEPGAAVDPRDKPGGHPRQAVAAWCDAAAAVDLLEARGGAYVRTETSPWTRPPDTPPATLDRALAQPPPGPDPRGRRKRVGPHPVGRLPAAALARVLGREPGEALVYPARRGGVVRDLRALGVRRVAAHEPDPALRGGLEAAAGPRTEVQATPATELGYHRDVDVAVADRSLTATRSVVGLLGRLHHALRPGGRLVLADVLVDGASPPVAPRNRAARSLRVHLRARGRDLVTQGELWRLLVETGYREPRFHPLGRGRWIVEAKR